MQAAPAAAAAAAAEMTVQQLRAALTEAGMVDELVALGTKAKKGDLVALLATRRG